MKKRSYAKIKKKEEKREKKRIIRNWVYTKEKGHTKTWNNNKYWYYRQTPYSLLIL